MPVWLTGIAYPTIDNVALREWNGLKTYLRGLALEHCDAVILFPSEVADIIQGKSIESGWVAVPLGDVLRWFSFYEPCTSVRVGGTAAPAALVLRGIMSGLGAAYGLGQRGGRGRAECKTVSLPIEMVDYVKGRRGTLMPRREMYWGEVLYYIADMM